MTLKRPSALLKSNELHGGYVTNTIRYTFETNHTWDETALSTDSQRRRVINNVIFVCYCVIERFVFTRQEG